MPIKWVVWKMVWKQEEVLYQNGREFTTEELVGHFDMGPAAQDVREIGELGLAGEMVNLGLCNVAESVNAGDGVLHESLGAPWLRGVLPWGWR